MKTKRPVNLDLTTIHFPITAIVSITHRVSGVINVVGVLILFWMLDASLRSPESFAELQQTLQHPFAMFILWGVLAAFAWHFCMGIRHLVMDLGVGESFEGGKLGAKLAIASAAVLILAAAGWIIW